MVIDGDVRANSDTPASLVAGVTEITGELDISRGQDLSAFDCLETVGDNIELDADEGDALEGAFPRLTTMGGGVRISGGLSEVSVSCAFRALTTIGTYWLNGGHVDVSGDITGELDLASLVEFHSIRINNTKIERVILPSNGTFSILQLKFDADPRLSEVLGLENTTLVGRAEDDTYTLLIRNNPLLSGCRAQAIGQMFLDGGYTPASVIVENNGPGCE